MVVIEICNNNMCELHGPRKDLHIIYKLMKVRNPNAFFLRKYMKPGWDGKQDFVKENGTFTTGLLERVGTVCDENNIEWDVMDNRPIKLKVTKVTENGDWKIRDYQLDAVKAIVTHKVKGVQFIRSTCKVATNGGKTSISGFIYLCLNREPTIFLMNSAELYRDAINDMPKIIGEQVGYMQGKSLKWGNFMVCMAATFRNRLKDSTEVRKKVAEYKVLIVDECDMAGNKTNKAVIESLYNTVARVGLSGTVNATKLKMDLIKHLTIEGFFGKQVYDISNKKLIEKGVSSKVEVKIIEGNTIDIPPSVAKTGGWMAEYEMGIVENKDRNKKVVKRSIFHYKNGRTNQLIIAQRHHHIEKLMKLYESAIKAGALPEGTVVDWVHHDRKDRAEVVDLFKAGKIDILIGSMILKRGKNFPLMTYMLNAGGGKSAENILQLLGRAFRGCTHYEDFWDLGGILVKHSRRRVIYYKNEKLTVLNTYR